ncbi:hypothetical protein DVH05_026721 [Phytophthora capsici]|nr:hypothetical protein DVH05_026721 [Phytophthora capsici]
MLDHLLPLIYREYEYFDEANKENYGYVIRRRARPVSSTVSTPARTPPRPPRRSSPSTRMHSGVISSRSLKRRRESTEDSIEQGPAKKKSTDIAAKTPERTATRSLKRRRDPDDDCSEERGKVKKQMLMQSSKKEEEEATVEKEEQKSAVEEEQQEQVKSDLVTPVKKPKEPKISAKKKMKPSRKTKVKTKQKTKVSKSATPKRIPLQDITHLYVNEHAHPYEYQQRERFVAGLTTSVAIRFF